MPTKEQLEQALVNAHKAGDANAARVLAGELRKTRTPDDYKALSAPTQVNPTEGMSGGQKFAAGMGRGMTAAMRGLDQIPRPGDLVSAMQSGTAPRLDAAQAANAEAEALDAPLMDTGAGMAGNVVGTAAALAPTALVPGANTYSGAAMLGGLGSAAITPGDMSERGDAAKFGAVGGFAGKGLGDALAVGGRALLNRATAKGAEQATAHAPRNAAIAGGRRIGMVAPPASANPTLLNKTLEGLSGKVSTAQKASLRNQEVVNRVARQALGLPDDVPVTPEALKSIRSQAGQAFEAMRGAGQIRADQQFASELGAIVQKFRGAARDFPELADDQAQQIVDSVNKSVFDADSAVDAISILRERASGAYAKGDKGLGKSYRMASDALEGLIERNLSQSGAPARQMLEQFRSARQLIAKTYTIESALDGGNVSAAKLAQMLKRGKPISGDLKSVAQFAGALPKATQDASKLGSVAGTSPLDWAVGLGSSAASGNPLLMGLVATRPIVRNALLSGPAQKLTTVPKYGPNALSRKGVEAVENRVTRNALTRVSTAYGSQE